MYTADTRECCQHVSSSWSTSQILPWNPHVKHTMLCKYWYFRRRVLNFSSGSSKHIVNKVRSIWPVCYKQSLSLSSSWHKIDADGIKSVLSVNTGAPRLDKATLWLLNRFGVVLGFMVVYQRQLERKCPLSMTALHPWIPPPCLRTLPHTVHCCQPALILYSTYGLHFCTFDQHASEETPSCETTRVVFMLFRHLIYLLTPNIVTVGLSQAVFSVYAKIS